MTASHRGLHSKIHSAADCLVLFCRGLSQCNMTRMYQSTIHPIGQNILIPCIYVAPGPRALTVPTHITPWLHFTSPCSDWVTAVQIQPELHVPSKETKQDLEIQLWVWTLTAMLYDELKVRKLRLDIRKGFVSRGTLNVKLGSRIEWSWLILFKKWLGIMDYY